MKFIPVFLVIAISVGCHGQSDGSSTTPETTPASTKTTTSTPAPTPSPTTPAPTTPESTTPPTPPPTTTPTTTTVLPPMTTTEPPKDDFYRVTEDNITCIMFAGDVKFSITYPTTSGESNMVSVRVPKPTSDSHLNINSSGSCNKDMQYLAIEWGPTNTRSSFKLVFNATDSKWMLIDTLLSIFIGNYLVNSTDASKYMHINGQFTELSMIPVDTNSSMICRAEVSSNNFTVSVVNGTGKYVASSNAIGVEMQAFNFIANDKNLQEGVRCQADVTSDLVPIAVGCALAGLVLLVLISYLVGRRRRSAAYQSV